MTLKVFLELTKADEVASWEHTNNQETAAALLVDADSEEGRLQLKDWARENKRQVLIAFSGRTEGFPENVLVLPRPLRSAELVPVLRQASKQFLSRFQEQKEQEFPQAPQSSSLDEKIDTKKIDATSASVGVRRVLEVLYGNQNKIIKIIDRVGRSVIFDIEHRRYYTTNLVKMEIEDLLASPIGNMQIEEVHHNQLAKVVQNLKAQDLDVPLWTAALAISAGHLFDGLSLTESYRLNRWPDLKKLGQDPLHLKLTALLRRGGNIGYFADHLKAPVEDVIDFINACRTLGYLEYQGKPTSVPGKKPSNTGKRSLFSRIRSRLGI
ncbi:MAG: hypothetical protein KDJ54_09695 [Candidatus Competibacteraceae bacterium]|nr:hypothetical protein [Candidatus Competibacteraceae bacterium]